LADNKGALRTYDAPTFSRHNCLNVAGWHTKAIEMCGAQNALDRNEVPRAGRRLLRMRLQIDVVLSEARR